MGRTQSAITPQYDKELQRLTAFRRALRRSDQLIFDELWAQARQHLPAAAYAAHPIPAMPMLVGMLVEVYKEVARLREENEQLRRRLDG